VNNACGPDDDTIHSRIYWISCAIVGASAAYDEPHIGARVGMLRKPGVRRICDSPKADAVALKLLQRLDAESLVKYRYPHNGDLLDHHSSM
jgi:hypothetical protein